jgi:tetratricopeptide (TPR) repeat protein
MLNKAFPQRPIVQTELGRLYLAKGNLGAARTAFEQTLAANPQQISALQGLTAIDIKEKKPEAARARIEAAIAKSDRNDSVQLLAGRTYASLGDMAAAEKAFKRALEINPANLDAYAALGTLYATEKRLAEATAEFDKLAQRQPKAIGPATTVAMLLQMQNKEAEAKERYQKIIAQNPHAAVAANNLAWIYAEEGQNLDVALQLAQTAKAALPDVPEVNDTLGWVYHKRGTSQLAITPLKESIAKDPNNGKYHYHLGVAYAGAGDAVKAREALERALSLQLSPAESADARKTLASLKS